MKKKVEGGARQFSHVCHCEPTWEEKQSISYSSPKANNCPRQVNLGTVSRIFVATKMRSDVRILSDKIVANAPRSVAIEFLNRPAEAERFALDSCSGQSRSQGLGTASFIFLARKMNSGDSNPSALNAKTGTSRFFCGGGRIRTFETLSDLTVFKTVPFDRSGTPPYIRYMRLFEQIIILAQN